MGPGSVRDPTAGSSQSIERTSSTGDDLAELIEEELVDLGYSARLLSIPAGQALHRPHTAPPRPTPQPTARFLLAYEACFRRLGDVGAGDDDGSSPPPRARARRRAPSP